MNNTDTSLLALDTNNKPKAFEAARKGLLQNDLISLAIADEFGYTAAHVAASYGKLLPCFDKWDWETATGWSVAHEAARSGTLPSDFTSWDIKANSGWAVAHTAAKYGTLPKNFKQWDIVTNKGWSVAHEAALHGNLPVNFNQWTLTDKRRVTVKQVHDSHNKKCN